jgi:hypothetical protein
MCEIRVETVHTHMQFRPSILPGIFTIINTNPMNTRAMNIEHNTLQK